MVHDNANFPSIESEGLHLGTGQAYKLGYKKRRYTYLPPPHGKCTTRISAAMRAMYDQFQPVDYDYDEDLCYILCTQSYM